MVQSVTLSSNWEFLALIITKYYPQYFTTFISPEVIQIIPAIEAKSQGVFLQTQSCEKLPYSLWCALEDRHLYVLR